MTVLLKHHCFQSIASCMILSNSSENGLAQIIVKTLTQFSASDNAILAFSFVHWISVISHYTCL